MPEAFRQIRQFPLSSLRPFLATHHSSRATISLKFFKNFQPNSFLSLIFDFKGGRGSIHSINSRGRRRAALPHTFPRKIFPITRPLPHHAATVLYFPVQYGTPHSSISSDFYRLPASYRNNRGYTPPTVPVWNCSLAPSTFLPARAIVLGKSCSTRETECLNP